MTRLPVWGLTVDTYGLVVRNLLTVVRLGLPALVVLIVSQALVMALAMVPMFDAMEAFNRVIEEAHNANGRLSEEEMLALSASMTGPMLAVMAGQGVAMLALLAVVAMAAVAWCRYAVLGDDRDGRWFAFRFGALEIEMSGALLVLGIGGFGAMIVIFAASVALVAWMGSAGQIVMAVLVTALFLALCRFFMLLPQVAVGGGLNPLDAWRRTRGQTLRLFAVYGLIGLPVMAVAMVLMIAALIVFVITTGMFESPTPGPERFLETMSMFRSPAGIAIWFVMNLLYLALNGLMLALGCVAMGLAHARLVASPADAIA